MRTALPEESLDAVHVFFPDPWPKARHHKRRLVQPSHVALLRSRLRVGGTLHCATDWVDYADAMLEALTADPYLENTATDFAPRPVAPAGHQVRATRPRPGPRGPRPRVPEDPMSTAEPRVFRVALVPGVNPDRWLRVWQERLRDVPVELVHLDPAAALEALRSGAADVALVRGASPTDDVSVIPLYTESAVVVVPKDHVVSVVDQIDASDLDDEIVLVPLDDQLHWADPPGTPFAGDPVATTADAIDLVAAGIGVLVLPQSLGRLHQRRGLTARVVRDAPGSPVGLAWVTDRYDDLVEEFIGIVRGRTATSSRGRGAPPAPAPASKSRIGIGIGRRSRGPGRSRRRGRGPGRGRPAARARRDARRRSPANPAAEPRR